MDSWYIMELLFKALSAIFIAGISSFITVNLSINKFRSERWWERKAQTYERVIEAFHHAKKLYAELLRAEEYQQQISETRAEELRSAAHIARDEILKASDIGSFLLSKDALKILTDYETESKYVSNQYNLHDELHLSRTIIDRYMKELITEAKRDLKIK